MNTLRPERRRGRRADPDMLPRTVVGNTSEKVLQYGLLNSRERMLS
jgi:hypothetical protein